MKKYCYVYKIVNKINNKFYIGANSSNSLEDRYMGSGSAIKAAIKKYGIDNFEKTIIEIFKSEKDMYDAEAKIVNEDVIRCPNSYNIILGGCNGTGTGINHPMYGKKRPEHSDFMKRNNPTKGKCRPQYIKDKVSQANKGRKHSNEVNNKKGRAGSKNSMFRKQSPSFGKTWINNGIESRLVNLNDCELEKSWKLGRIPTSMKSVFQIDRDTKVTIQEFPSLKEAGEETNISKHSISACCSGKLQTAGGYIWKFK